MLSYTWMRLLQMGAVSLRAFPRAVPAMLGFGDVNPHREWMRHRLSWESNPEQQCRLQV
jgi:hypothetical protein